MTKLIVLFSNYSDTFEIERANPGSPPEFIPMKMVTRMTRCVLRSVMGTIFFVPYIKKKGTVLDYPLRN